MAKCKITLSFLFLFFFATFITSFSYAQTIDVYPGGSIQVAIDDPETVSGDTVFVHAGTYVEDITMKNGVTLEGESYARVIIKGRVFFKDATCTLKDVTVSFPQSSLLSYNNAHYSDWKLDADAGITVINSVPTIQNCVIKPDLDLIDPTGTLEHYGKAIQIWNMYSATEAMPQIQGNLIRDTNCGIYYFSQAFGGAIEGDIKNNTFYHNKIGVLLRMHKENPHIYNNIFHSCIENVIHYTYETGDLSPPRTSILNNNLLWDYSIQGWLDETSTEFSISGVENNIAGDPGFINIDSDSFYLLETSPCLGTGEEGTDIGAYPTDLQYPTIENILPIENRLIEQLNIDISGSVFDDNGILYVFVDSNPATVSGTTFVINGFPLNYGFNDINITATDLARQSTVEPKPIYIFRAPVAPPAQ